MLSEGKRDKSDCVIISKVLRGSPAANAGLRLVSNTYYIPILLISDVIIN